MYAIGGSASPTINSQGNRYLAPRNRFAKEVLTLRSYKTSSRVKGLIYLVFVLTHCLKDDDGSQIEPQI